MKRPFCSGRGGSRRRPAGICGFTLVELLVVVALLATLASLAVPSFNSFLARRAVDATADGLRRLRCSDDHEYRRQRCAASGASQISRSNCRNSSTSSKLL
ncbi:prepilin-type N-terminal cleavage/methylation domain-containing protein [Variovorax sp. LjRoot84]|uniref:prepilin-type N-terminal cleavage/methylation domain-containing protein n=1 Tax=Variovorax sp. LjRoot84 TaxID=3342340 RepID=UPI003ECED270